MASAYAMHLNAIVLLCRIWLTTLLPMLVCSVLATAVSNVQRLTSIIDVRAFNFRVSALRGLRLAGGSGQCAESGSGQWAECREWQAAVGSVRRESAPGGCLHGAQILDAPPENRSCSGVPIPITTDIRMTGRRMRQRE